MKTDVTLPEPLVRRFMPELDVLRGIAVLGVLFFHGFGVEYGNVGGAAKAVILVARCGAFGVNLFFVLSGFLITGILLDSRSRPDYYRRFYVRRVLRILPAYYSLLLLLALLHQGSAAFLGLSFIYLSNVTSLFGVSMDYNPLWSLAVEEHYYILWPSVVRKLKTRFLAIFSIAICVIVPVIRALAFHYGYFQGTEWSTWYQADGLALGSLLGIALRTLVTRKQATVAAAALLGVGPALLLAGAPFGLLSRQTELGASLQLTLVNVFFAGLLLLFLVLGSSSRRILVNNSFLQFFGYISYGLYLIQLLIFRLFYRLTQSYWPGFEPSGHLGLMVFRFAVVSSVAITVAYVSRKYFEEYFLRLKDRPASAEDRSTTTSAPSSAVPESPEVALAAKVAARDVG